MRSLIAALMIVCFAAPAYAATTPSTSSARVTITGWRLECDPGKAALACRVLDSIVSASNGALVISLNFSAAADGKTVLTMNVPLGAAVRTPVGVSVNGGPSQNFPFLTCSPQGCYATGTVSADLLAAMRAGKGDLRVTYGMLDANLAEHGITATLSLTGFSQVDDRLK
ncbi:MAG TPA: invasion associated locus B family protein [Candidatus Baltobacteraceae bacterium]|nr:invasion associated locus B family protein [Candidatus Baltobacteraceae bacterium]